MCDSTFCSDFLTLLTSCDQRLSGHKKNDHSNFKELTKKEVDVILGYIQLWPQRQCMCCYRDLKNFDRFNFVIRSLIFLIVVKLKDVKTLIVNTAKLELKNAEVKTSEPSAIVDVAEEMLPSEAQQKSDNQNAEKKSKSDDGKERNDKSDDIWILPDIEKALIFVSKVFLLNFPLYVAHKHGIHGRIDEITPQDLQSLSMFCDIHDTEIPVYLYRNVTLFCTAGGFAAMLHCFELNNLPVSTAHSCTMAISNIKLWLNYRSIVQLFVPLRIKILQYMCKLSDQDLRSSATKSMADFMWSAIKDPLDSQISFDTEGLALAFKYFTSSTLTMRLAGMSQINAHINLFNDICTTETVAEVELIGRKLADWLTENQIISHLFGPNLHVEVIKQSHIVLNFLAVENHITEDHVTLIWQAAQLKHCSKTIYDILPSLVKNLAPKPATHLYTLLCRLDPKEHTEQSIYIISALTKLIWARDRGRQMSVHESANISREIAEIQSSSENSVSVDGSNSEDDSSDCRKSPIDVDGSDSGAPPPCKQARHITTVTKKKGSDDTKAQVGNYNLEKEKRALYPVIGGRNDRFHPHNTSSDEESADVSDNVLKARKKFRKRRRKIGHLTRKEIQEMVESISDGDSDCDPLFGGSDCSEREDVLERLNKDESFFRAISENCHLMDYLRSAENDESSSPISNKSEKNMADFDDEDSPCEEELAQLTATSSHYSTSPRNRMDHNRSNTPNNLQKSQKNHVKNSGSSGNEKNKSNSSNVSSPMRARSPDVCQPGNTLLWDLLQDDKIGWLGEALALETEKTLSSLLCFHTEKFVRKKFIEACLTNIANNRSVIVSLRLIPKLLASFQQFRDVGTHQVTIWAERTHKMMHHFFNNLKCYCNHVKQLRTGAKPMPDQPPIALVRNQNGNYFYSHTTQIQVRLQFLASIFCDIGSPKTFRLTTNQIDVLWSCLSYDPECADCLFHWLQGQAKGNAQHALSSQSLQHIYMKKWPELKPENISMVALTLFQQLFILGLSDELRNEKADVLGMDNLWKIALRANDTEVSMAAIQYINTYYMEHQLKNEKEFVAQCMNYLTQAADGLNKPEVEEQSIMCVQRALMLLNTHLETFRRRYAYHLRRWTLEGRGIISHSALRAEGPGPPIKIILQPGGLPEKSYLHLYQTDLVADLKAEIAKWWENLQGTIKSSGGAPVLGNLLSDGPLRIITQGQEITSEYDERSLIDVGFKDNQMVYVSLGGRSGRRRDHADHPSMLPAPSKDCLPTILLLQSPYFEQLFKLMQSLGDMKLTKKSGSTMQHTQAQVLSRRVWDILAMLPTSPTLLETFKNFSLADKSTKTDDKTFNIRDILDPSNLQKFMYSLHIVESLCKSKFAASVKNSSMTANQRNQLKMKIAKAKAAKKAASKENSENSIEELKSSSDEKKSEKENENGVNSKDQSDTDINISKEESSIEMKIKKSIEWSNQFIKSGGLEHLYEILMTGVLQKQDGNYNEWRYDCLCSLLRILCLLGVDDLKQEENIIVIPKLNDNMLKIMDVKSTIGRISSILNEAAVPLKDNHYKTGFWGRSQVVNFAMNLLVCFAYSSQEARETLWIDTNNYSWLQKLILDDPDPHVRRETCAALYRLCMGNSKTYSELMIPLLVKLISFLPVAEKMKTQTNCYSIIEDGKEPYGQACRDYFWLLSRLVDNTTPDLIKPNLVGDIQNNMTIDIEALCNQVSQLVMNRDYLEGRHIQDDGLVGLLNLMANLVKYDPPFKYSQSGQQFIAKIFECLFALPTAENRDLPKCKSQGARAASYDLLIELTRNAPSNYMLLHKMLMLQHRPGPHSPYPWDYWPRDDGRSECGYVGLTNLGATCYMASCIQHIFMMPQARESILSVPTDAPVKHKQTFSELQKMFAYLMESERKSYNPRSFCKVYQMDHQPLNTGEQKDMAEFFIDLVSKLEEMTPELKALVKQIFCGVISNNVVSLDCGHVSRTLEEFYTVRCQVADMRNLQESLDEVTVKDTLEGDNMYTCSQCGRKVRAEKRACFKKLPQILCFNTMRYTFNMVTMLKEKVNTHFSFPLRLDMSRYVEKTLMPHHYEEEKLKSQMRRKVSESESVQSASNSETKQKSEQMSQGDDSPSETSSTKPDVDENEQIKQEQQIIEEEESEDFNENYEYDLVGVTVHTGTADGGHYYSFIKERDNGKGSPSDRWFLFNDAEVKLFDPSQIAAECFGGEMTSKTYDSVTEKYLDFSFEKTNSAYMLFYEWRSGKGEQRNQSESPTTMSPGSSVSQLQEAGKSDEAQASTSDHVMAVDDKIETNSTLHLSEVAADCDIETKLPSSSVQAKKADEEDATSSSSLVRSKRKSLLNKDLEEWIWQDNRHYLEDRNIFEHTYFNFMWQICGHVPQSLLVLNDITFRAAQLSVSFFMETFIHAKEKPTMVLWVELLTKQFNASQEACEWFLQHMSQEPWWPVQVLIQCPNQMVRQMFQRLVIHVIQRLRPLHFNLYLQNESEEDGAEAIGEMSCVTKFIKSLILLLENGAKAHLRHLTEFFGLLYEFSRMGEEETKFLLQTNVIKSVADFYLGHKNQDCIDSTSDNDENSSDEALSVEKTRPVSLDKMIALVATLVERSRGTDHTLSLSSRDYNAIAGGKGFPFLYQQIKDNINPNQTRLLIHALCRYDERLAGSIIAMLFNAVTKHTELCGPFFKLLTLLTESSSGPSGLPCFSQLVLQRVWDAAEFCPQPSLEWLAIQAPRNKVAHAWILSTAENWVEQFLIAHPNLRVRNAAANLLVSLIPSQTFRQNYRASTHHKMIVNNPQREITGEALIILHSVLSILLKLLRAAKNYTDISSHGTVKLTSYFGLMAYCMITKTEKLMLGPHIKTLWELFHPKLSEPSVPAHHNKQALLAFWHHATVDCPENALQVVNNPEITKNIAFNYILADHDDSEVVQYNRSMLPAYYGLLRLCCQQSRALTRQLAGHQNLQWAFKNITPHPTQYNLAVDELFKLMAFFVAKYPDSSQTELDQICVFRRQTLSAYLSGLDARVSWNTLVSALRILVENEEDRLFFVSNGGLTMCFEALLTLHSMYHEATACNVTEDLQDLLREIVRLVQALRQSCREQKKKYPPSGYFKGLPEVIRRLTTLLNTFNPPEMRKLTLDVLKELVRCIPTEAIGILTPILTHCHIPSQQHSMGPLGTFFPRRNTKNSGQNSSPSGSWQSGSKNIPRPPRPMIQMNIPRTQAFTNVKGVDKEFDLAVERFYKPYHEFLDIFFRAAVTSNIFSETLVNLSLVTGVEAVGWHFNFFPTFWVGINKNKNTQRYTELFVNNCLIHEYIDRILKDERISLNDSMIANFIEIYYGKVRTQLSLVKLLDAICSSMVQKENWEEICGDLHAVRIIGQTGGFPKSAKENLKRSLQCVLQKSKDFASEAEAIATSAEKSQSSSEESPPKKRRIDAAQVSKTNEEKVETPAEPAVAAAAATTAAISDPKDEKAPIDLKEEMKSESETKEVEKNAAAAVAATSATPSGSTSVLVSTRNDLIKDIESHIEIIYECLDELNETGSTSSLNKTAASNEPMAISAETSSQESDKSSKEEATEKSETKPTDPPPAQDESKNE